MWPLAVSFAATLAGLASAEPLSPARQREILRDALGAFDRAVEVVRDDPALAVDFYRRAAAGLLALRESGLRNFALDYNLGNIYFRLGDHGRAILHYRRAAAIEPTNASLLANLRYARDRVEPRIAPSGQQRLVRQLLFWHHGTSMGQRFWALVVLSVGGWSTLALWLRWRSRGLLVGGLIGAAAAMAVGSSLLWQIRADTRCPPAVVVGGEVHLRLARGESADLALKQPLGPGVELGVLQQRGDWVEVRLPNDQTGWLPAAAIERI
jgi:tetratricopeptide (TPR) repeat protein